jgi:hypothetical protein
MSQNPQTKERTALQTGAHAERSLGVSFFSRCTTKTRRSNDRREVSCAAAAATCRFGELRVGSPLGHRSGPEGTMRQTGASFQS